MPEDDCTDSEGRFAAMSGYVNVEGSFCRVANAPSFFAQCPVDCCFQKSSARFSEVLFTGIGVCLVAPMMKPYSFAQHDTWPRPTGRSRS